MLSIFKWITAILFKLKEYILIILIGIFHEVLYKDVNITNHLFNTIHCSVEKVVGYINILKGIQFRLLSTGNRGSSVSIVSDYGLDDLAIEVRSTAGARDFSSNICVQTGFGAHPASCTMGTGGPFPGVKARPGRDTDHSPQVPRSWMSRSYTSSPLYAPIGVLWECLVYCLQHHFFCAAFDKAKPPEK
jgi:hypothetical protein